MSVADDLVEPRWLQVCAVALGRRASMSGPAGRGATPAPRSRRRA